MAYTLFDFYTKTRLGEYKTEAAAKAVMTKKNKKAGYTLCAKAWIDGAELWWAKHTETNEYKYAPYGIMSELVGEE